MRLSPCPSGILVLLPLATGISIDCSDVRIDGKYFNLEKLGGPHSVYLIEKHPNKIENTTIKFDICHHLERIKGVPNEEDCPGGSRVCAIEREHFIIGNSTNIGDVVPIAGEYSHTIGGALDPKWSRMPSSPPSEDNKKKGIRLEMNGGKFQKRKQKAIVEFECNARAAEIERSSTKTLTEDDEDEDKSGEEVDDQHGGKISFRSWEEEEEVKVLRLDWLTQYACEDGKDGGNDSSRSNHWGPFTWFIIIVFMAIAAYLIFGSWLNYNRYSARGWDLLPHSETIRDIPYFLKDTVRRIVSTAQGGGSRGGYSAV